MDYIVHGVAKSWTGLSDFHFHFTVIEEIYFGTVSEETYMGVENKK